MQQTEQLRQTLLGHVGHADGMLREHALMLPSDRGALYSVLIQPTGETGSVGVVVCPSWFELRMLQVVEFALLRAAAASGVPGRYVQPAGTGDSERGFEVTTVAARVEAALLGAARLRRDVPGLRRVVYAGARLGAAIAVLAAGRDPEPSDVIAWDPSFDPDEYWRQSRRFARVVGALGRNRVENADEVLARGERAYVVGYPVTQELRTDLSSIGEALRHGRVSERAFLASLNDASLLKQRRDLGRVVDQVDAVRLGPPKARNLIRLRIEDAERAVVPSVEWILRSAWG